ncbi:MULTISPECIES: universal stress protein [Streptomyces]|uniref:universal stress protein n=1 Tax=Streptomyces scabiei TaxID=1930 RepID=UPI0004E73C37|nr:MULTISPECIES: universal stress protein [Streptomyces]MBP5859824.1 universal stress protein [Streptomyces sp. LBUM 1484]KFG06311.1 stress-inducible protein [Streptomyces scabiei]MBP5879919.1 universal stress protein [Streptomyces sp. LBUM 1477]MBP5887746.1 universal stress protein [Streptomyces sp. LBUM 1487]MBP5903752.1 universal stress protein [Streptomyces sp. LBUM 1488]
MTHNPVVVGVDGTLSSTRALDWAAGEAVQRGVGLRLVYAVPDRDEAAPILNAALSRVRGRHPGIPVRAVAAEGGAVGALARESADAALTVVGTRGMGRTAGLFLGSVSLRLARHVRGPLLVVRGDHPCDGGREVVLGLQDDTDERAAVYAFEEARRRGTRLRVLHSWSHRHVTPALPPLVSTECRRPDPATSYERVEEAVPRFALAALRERYADVPVEAVTVRTSAPEALLESTREAGLVVVGAHRRTSAVAPHRTAVAPVLLHRAHCPVVVVPAA